MKKNIKRGADNSTLTISLSKTLKDRITKAAEADRRKVSPWCSLRLEEIVDALEMTKPSIQPLSLMVADQTLGNEASLSTRAPTVPIKYPAGKRPKKEA